MRILLYSVRSRTATVSERHTKVGENPACLEALHICVYIYIYSIMSSCGVRNISSSQESLYTKMEVLNDIYHSFRPRQVLHPRGSTHTTIGKFRPIIPSIVWYFGA